MLRRLLDVLQAALTGDGDVLADRLAGLSERELNRLLNALHSISVMAEPLARRYTFYSDNRGT